MYGYVVIHIVEALSWVEFCKFPGWWTGDDNRTKLVPGYNKILVLFCFCAHTLCVCFCLWFLSLKGSTTTKSVPVFYPLFCFFLSFFRLFRGVNFPFLSFHYCFQLFQLPLIILTTETLFLCSSHPELNLSAAVIWMDMSGWTVRSV